MVHIYGPTEFVLPSLFQESVLILFVGNKETTGDLRCYISEYLAPSTKQTVQLQPLNLEIRLSMAVFKMYTIDSTIHIQPYDVHIEYAGDLAWLTYR